ncbi:hypothetical protein ASPZODRAFT_106801 [Penicilliopsis zonata CBS 506.65]|uniref:Uncharacterized protein n=1 Tax=Penicilliopsis zonata CBS 506.65 TaxID=1073090 RepID=A0A1L9SUV2_9EURO|nr:hypothetical protein ASPZODRAFT_106801 [Penicilliopsis zonata CBS 506.65]OJJ50857.1 hypothetical protein ASPZODRAFT_106801 [Penicilliopsis zonata CBS 506.65]
MGLGKTLQTLSFLQHVKEHETAHTGRQPPFLVVCPLSVMGSWMTEADKWAPDLTVLKYYGTSEERQEARAMLASRRPSCSKNRPNGADQGKATTIDVVVTTYETLASDLTWFQRSYVWRGMILDEGHRIKNYLATRSQAIKKVRCEYKLVLTGTPVQNDLLELWSIFHWLFPDVFTKCTAGTFKEAFRLNEGQVDKEFIEYAKRFLDLIMLRRTKETPGIGLDIPSKKEVALTVPLAELQARYYMKVLTGVSDSFPAQGQQDISTDQTKPQATDSKPTIIIRNILMELRKCSIHPYLTDSGFPEVYVPGQHLVTNSGKFAVLQKLVQQFVVIENQKIIIFSGFEQALDLCEDVLDNLDGNPSAFKYVRLDGRTPSAWRNLNVFLFSHDPRYMIFLISIRAGGEGLNLTSASTVIFLDEDWNPSVMRQAEARVHRIGQTKPVQIFKLYSQGTIEEQMRRRSEKKSYLGSKVIDSVQALGGDIFDILGTDMMSADSMNVQAISSFINRNSSSSLSSIDVDFANWDYETVIERCSLRPGEHEFSSKADEESWLHRSERIQTDIFNGERVDTRRRKFRGEDLKVECLSPESRRVGKNRTLVIDGYYVNKASLECRPGEAVSPMFKGCEPMKKTEEKTDKLMHEEMCFVCHKSHRLEQCKICPRSFHTRCMRNYETDLWGHHTCSSHSCSQCERKAAQAGGLIFACAACPDAFCEQCLDWSAVVFLGENTPYSMLNYHPSNSFYVVCRQCQVKRSRKRHAAEDKQGIERATRPRL